ncbi:hypothetical protein [Caulobacter vibrioides]|uniref:Uncharacterized protein n=1 Tax=Caulobacter vibrioides (strain NA1000 / CB15N) TaxID=565050 RepID=A0A0H3J1G6_CAUVN|nr:hypothetical protein [Caulobacter vibrioides]YP_009020489.1 hypothetical protein CCNA_03918 [Caulobacter vibrioides NA1000]AHI88520.1 hypothetical protein CCNA_03918 [Caulobacter vibrioides NA1000]AVH77049.1 hypothetical protein CA607_20185 [Caulobacter vibrioides]QXZ52458.1 hypothetical protein KZH45_01880 [Caulobacter vibrioides]
MDVILATHPSSTFAMSAVRKPSLRPNAPPKRKGADLAIRALRLV